MTEETFRGEPLRLALLSLSALCVLAFAVAVATAIGDYDIPLRTVFLSITNKLGLSSAPLSRIEESVVWNLRLSRALVAALCGAGLAICGAILQSLLRNPLAEPFVLRVSAGASTGAVSVIILGIGAGMVSLSLGATLSSRSRLMTSAAEVAIFSNRAGRDPGPNSWKRLGRAGGVGWRRKDMRTS